MGDLAVDLHGVACVELVSVGSIAVPEGTAQNVDEFDAGMLEEWEHFVRFGESHEHRFYLSCWTTQCTEVLVAASWAAPLVDDIEALTGPYDDGVVFLVESGEEGSDWYVAGPG